MSEDITNQITRIDLANQVYFIQHRYDRRAQISAFGLPHIWSKTKRSSHIDLEFIRKIHEQNQN